MNESASVQPARVPASIVGLLTVAAAMILPYVHIWIHGADKLVALHVARRQAQGLIPQKFLYVSKQVAQNRIEAQGLIDAITVGVTLVLFTLVVWLLSRWRTVRLPLSSAVRAASVSIWAEMAFYGILYVMVWAVLGQEAMRISWTGLVPTEASRLAVPGSFLWALLRTIGIGTAIRFVVLALALRHEDQRLTSSDSWLIAGGAALTVTAAGVFLQRL